MRLTDSAAQKENIYINTVLPGIVNTPIVPQEMIDAVAPDCVTSVSTIVAAYDEFLSEENQHTGESVECSVDKHFLVPQPGYVNGKFSKRAVTVWDPLFKKLHGENSGLPDAIS